MNYFDVDILYKKEFKNWKKYPKILEYSKKYLYYLHDKYPLIPKCTWEWIMTSNDSPVIIPLTSKCTLKMGYLNDSLYNRCLVLTWRNSSEMILTKYFYDDIDMEHQLWDNEFLEQFMRVVSFNDIWATFSDSYQNYKPPVKERLKKFISYINPFNKRT